MASGAIKITITGANGFVGTNLISIAKKHGWSVTGIVRNADAAALIEKLGATSYIIPAYDTAELHKAIIGTQVVIHTIAIGRGSEKNLMETNVNLLGRVLQVAKTAKVNRFIYLSGLGVGEKTVESGTHASYFKSKAMAEHMVKQSGIPYVIFRPSFIIGPGDYLVTALMHDIAGGRVLLPGTTDSIIQPIFVEDAANAILSAAMGTGLANQVYDLVGPLSMQTKDFIQKIYETIATYDVNLSQPLIESVPLNKWHDMGTESLDFLESSATSEPEPLKSALNITLTPLDETVAKCVQALLKPDEKIPEKRAVLLLSGGLDSVTSLYWALKEGFDIIPVTMHYFERPLREIRAMREHMRRLGLKLIEVPTPYLKEVFELKLEGFPVPSIFGAGEAYVPYRNLIFNAIATYYADIFGAKYIISGHIVTDPLPDANQAFFDALEHLVNQLKVGTKAVAPKFLLPMKGKSKYEVVKMAIDLRVPIEWTWSCEFDGAQPCGKCKPCRERLEAFERFGMEDPVANFYVPDWRETPRVTEQKE